MKYAQPVVAACIASWSLASLPCPLPPSYSPSHCPFLMLFSSCLPSLLFNAALSFSSYIVSLFQLLSKTPVCQPSSLYSLCLLTSFALSHCPPSRHSLLKSNQFGLHGQKRSVRLCENDTNKEQVNEGLK